MLVKLNIFFFKKLSYSRINKSGRNNLGRITAFHRGGRQKRKIRRINFYEDRKLFFWMRLKETGCNYPTLKKSYTSHEFMKKTVVSNLVGTENSITSYGTSDQVCIPSIERIEYDPFRSAPIALLKYPIYSNLKVRQYDKTKKELSKVNNDKKAYYFTYVIASEMMTSKNIFQKASLLRDIPIGSQIYNLQIKKGNSQAIFIRSAGTFGILIQKSNFNNQCTIRLPSGRNYYVSQDCTAIVGRVASKISYSKIRKAGQNRYRGIRPTVRQVAMNAIDRKHGGGRPSTLPQKKTALLRIKAQLFKPAPSRAQLFKHKKKT